MLLCSGLEKTGNTVNAPARFTVETFAAGRANLEIIVLTAGGATIPVSIYLMSMDNKNALHTIPHLHLSCIVVPFDRFRILQLI